ncbi:tRNA (guanosine(37)-N1)-methyltransferase TrmD [Clostridium sediminicola]
MKIDILTLFPEMFDIFNKSIIGRAQENNLVHIDAHNIRDYSKNKHNKVDDYPYGGGSGMILTPQPIVDAIKDIKSRNKGKIIFLGPRGKTFDSNLSKELSDEKELVFLCGHYEGIDERIYKYIDLEISIGDFILTGGEMACIPVIDSILRFVPGVLKNENCYTEESFYDGLLEYPQYTRPEIFENERVPDVLLSGHHENIRKWRRKKSLINTKEKRIDLFKKVHLSKEDKKLLKEE